MNIGMLNRVPNKKQVEVFAMMYWCAWLRTLEWCFKMKYRKNHKYHLASYWTTWIPESLKIVNITKYKKQSILKILNNFKNSVGLFRCSFLKVHVCKKPPNQNYPNIDTHFWFSPTNSYVTFRRSQISTSFQ